MISQVTSWTPSSPFPCHHSASTLLFLNSCPSLFTHSSLASFSRNPESHSQMQVGQHPFCAKSSPRAPQRSSVSLVEPCSSYRSISFSAPHSSPSPPDTQTKLHRWPCLRLSVATCAVLCLARSLVFRSELGLSLYLRST